MLVDITENVLVDAPPATVWALVTDIRRHPEVAGPKSITKAVEFDGPVAPESRPGAASWRMSDSDRKDLTPLPTSSPWIRSASSDGCRSLP